MVRRRHSTAELYMARLVSSSTRWSSCNECVPHQFSQILKIKTYPIGGSAGRSACENELVQRIGRAYQGAQLCVAHTPMLHCQYRLQASVGRLGRRADNGRSHRHVVLAPAQLHGARV